PQLFLAPVLIPPHPAPAGTWYCGFHLRHAPTGQYILTVFDPSVTHPAILHVPITIKAAHPHRSHGFGQFPPPSYPTAGTSTNHHTFHSNDTAYGIAATCTPPFNSNFTLADGQMCLGLPLPNDPSAPAGYWAHAYFGLPTNDNCATFNIINSALQANTHPTA